VPFRSDRARDLRDTACTDIVPISEGPRGSTASIRASPMSPRCEIVGGSIS
jgi:hypothetical protein